jgi:Fic family protein
MVIYKALLVYGYENFTLEILEHCDPLFVLEREQHYIDLLEPKYNILKVAGSSFGYRHTEEALLKMRNRRASSEARAKMSANNHKRQSVVVLNNQTGISTKFFTMKEAGIFLNITTATVGRYLKNKKIFKGIYTITKNN